MKLSFVVIAFNEEGHIGRCVDAIAAQKGLARVQWEVIVVDDGSVDCTADVAASRHPHVRVVRLGVNRGRGAARAAGVAASTGELVALVDADVVLPPDWLARCRAAIGGADAVGGIAVPDGDVSYVASRFGLTPKARPGATVVMGSNGLYRRRVFDAVAFDPGLRDGEDVALVHAMALAGLRGVCLPQVVVRHEEHKSYTDSLVWLYQSGRGATRQLLRYRRVRVPDVATAMAVTVGAISVAGAAWGRWAVTGVAPAWLVGLAAVHLAYKFEARRPEAARWPAAVCAHAGLLGAYFAGRLTGAWARTLGSSAAPSPAAGPERGGLSPPERCRLSPPGPKWRR